MVTVTAVDQGVAPTVTALKYDGHGEATTSTTPVDYTSTINSISIADNDYYWLSGSVVGGFYARITWLLGTTTVLSVTTYGTYSHINTDGATNKALQNTQGSSQIIKMQMSRPYGASQGTTSTFYWFALTVMTPAEMADWEFMDIGSMTPLTQFIRYRKQYINNTYAFCPFGDATVSFDGKKVHTPSQKAVVIINTGTVISQYGATWTADTWTMLAFKMTGSKFTAT